MHRRNGFKICFELIGLVKPMLPVMICAIIFGTLGFLVAIMIPSLGALAIVNITTSVNYVFTPQTIIVLLAVFAISRGFLRYGEQAANHYIAFKILAILRDKIFRQLRKLAPAKLETQDKGNLISLITSDVELLEVFYAHTISPIAIAISTSFIMVVIISQISIILSIVTLIGYILVGIVVPLYISSRSALSAKKFRDESGNLSSLMYESLRGIGDINQYQQSHYVSRQIDNQSSKQNQAQYNLKKEEGKTISLTNLVIMVTSLMVLVVGSILVESNRVPGYLVFITFVLTISSFGPVVALANLGSGLAQTLAAGDRIINLLNEKPETEEVISDIGISDVAIKIDEIDFSYPNEQIFENLSLNFESGKVIGISGASGCGKSTLLKLIMRFWQVERGSINIGGVSINEIDTSNLRSNQSLVSQTTVLFNKSIADNIRVGKPNCSLDEVIRAAKMASIDEFIKSLPKGYNTNVGELGNLLSGGERQRIGLARAFIHNADMIILDEPTANLDALNESIILNSIKKASANKLVILVSHRRSTLSICDHVVNMETKRYSKGE